MVRKIIYIAVFFILAAVLVKWTVKKMSGPLPSRNVLLITLDTTRADHLGCYGYTRNTSPNIDRLAEESVVFDMAIAQAAVTPVSHASILTGLYPYNHGLRVLHGLVDNRLEDSHQTLAEVWKGVGGRTAAFVSAYTVTSLFGLSQGFEHFDERFLESSGEKSVSDKGIVVTGRNQRRADDTTRAAIDWFKKETGSNMPWFVWVHYFDPHDTLFLPPLWVQAKFPPLSKDRGDRLRALYDSEIYYMDFQIGRLIDTLKKLGMWNDTVVVAVADHGEGLGDHDWWSHGILYEEQIRVPMIVRVPGGKRGVRVPSIVRAIDLAPTILNAAGIDHKVWPRMDGVDLKRIINNGGQGEGLAAYSDSVNILMYPRADLAARLDKKLDKLYCLIKGRYKLIYHQLRPEESELYDLTADPGELDNLASTLLTERRVLTERLKRLNAFSDIMPGVSLPDREREKRLKSLGYLQ